MRWWSFSKAKSTPDVPLADIPLSERIINEIRNGVYECAICTLNLPTNTGPVWSCKNCYHVYHHDCISKWAYMSGLNEWSCPTCNKTHELLQGGATCWCGNTPRNNANYQRELQVGNSCGTPCAQTMPSSCNKCAGTLSFKDIRCTKLCHAGPCEFKNCDTCPSESTSQNRGFESPILTRKSLCLIAAFLFSMVSFAGMACWNFYYFGIVTQPLKHQYNIEHNFKALGVSHIAGLIILVIFGQVTSGVALMVHFLGDRRQSPSRCRNIVGLVSVLLPVGLGSSIFVWGLIGRDFMWSKQMRDTCFGFDARIGLDEYGHQRKKPYIFPSKSFTIEQTPGPAFVIDHSPGLGHLSLTLERHPYLPLEISAGSNSSEPFQSYHRLMGTLSPEHHLIVDFDLSHNAWRITDFRYAKTTKIPSIPNLTMNSDPRAVGTPRNGSWSQVSPDKPHAHLPELNLQIPNLHLLTKNCMYQPFTKVFRTTNMTTKEVEEQSAKDWTISSEDNVIMRTAAFGSVSSELQVCARKGDHLSQGMNSSDTLSGWGDDLVVPLGLIAVLRMQMKADGHYKEGACGSMR